MNHALRLLIGITRMGFALGATSAMVYLGYAFVRLTVPPPLYASQGELVTDGVYRYVRHPQYAGIFIITLGFMIQWPTLATLIL